MSIELTAEIESETLEVPCEEPEEKHRRPWSTVFLSLTDQAVVSGVRFIVSLVIARIAGKEEFGVYSIVFGMLLIATCIQEALICAPFTLFYARETGKNRSKYQASVLAQMLLVGAISSLSFGIFASWLHVYGDPAGLKASVIFLAISVPFILFQDFARRIEMARLRSQYALCVDAISGALQLSFLYFLVQSNALLSQNVLFAIGISCSIASVGWAMIAFRDLFFEPKRVGQEIRRHFMVGRWSFLAQLVTILQTQSVIWLVGWNMGTGNAGIFAACNYVLFLMNPFALGICNAIFPLAVRTQRESGNQEVGRLITKAMLSLGLIVGVFSTVVFFNSDRVLQLLYKSESYSGYHLLMFLLGMNITMSVIQMMNDQGVWAVNRPTWLLHSSLLIFLISVLLAPILVPTLGLVGAAVSLIAGRIVGLSYQTIRFFELVWTHSSNAPNDLLVEANHE